MMGNGYRAFHLDRPSHFINDFFISQVAAMLLFIIHLHKLLDLRQPKESEILLYQIQQIRVFSFYAG